MRAWIPNENSCWCFGFTYERMWLMTNRRVCPTIVIKAVSPPHRVKTAFYCGRNTEQMQVMKWERKSAGGSDNFPEPPAVV